MNWEAFSNLMIFFLLAYEEQFIFDLASKRVGDDVLDFREKGA